MKAPKEIRAQSASNELLLTELDTGQLASIVDLGGGSAAKLRLRSLGLLEGQLIQKVSRIGRTGPIVVLVDRTQIAVGYGMARKIVVRND